MKFVLTVIISSLPLSVMAQVPPALISPARLAQIQIVTEKLTPAQLMAGVAVRPNVMIPGPAWSRQLPTGSFEVQLNPTLLRNFSASAADLVLYHELGHVRLGHHAMLAVAPNRAHDLELEADAFAAFVFRQRHPVDAGLVKFLQAVASRTGTVPSGPERLCVIAPLLGLPLSSNACVFRP